MTPPAKARQIEITCAGSHAAVAPPNGPKQAVAVSWCSSAVRLVATRYRNFGLSLALGTGGELAAHVRQAATPLRHQRRR